MRAAKTMADLASLSRFGIRLGLERMAFLLDRLGHPEREFAVVHVGGTNGKGSVSAMIAAALTAAGHRTALFTSPHLERWTERYVLDGAEMTDARIHELIAECWPLVEAAQRAGLDPPTEFEFLTAMAYVWARAERADVLVQEVGLGGRLDSTNLVERPELAVLTNVALDHTDRLGSTIEAIAREKAGIVKPGRPVVSGLSGPSASVLRERAHALGAPLYELDERARFAAPPPGGDDDPARPAPAGGAPRARDVSPVGDRLTGAADGDPVPGAAAGLRTRPALDYRGPEWRAAGLPLALPGLHQVRNAALALLALEVLNGEGRLAVPLSAATRALATVRWPGRMETTRVPGGPLVILDGAHNADAALALAESLPRAFRWRRLHAVLGMLDDKDVETALPLLARHADRVFLAPPPSPRAASIERMRGALAVDGVRGAPAARATGTGTSPDLASERRAADMWRGASSEGGADRAMRADRPVSPSPDAIPHTRDAIAHADAREAFHAALSGLGPQDAVLVAGSLYLVGAVRPLCARDDSGTVAAGG